MSKKKYQMKFSTIVKFVLILMVFNFLFGVLFNSIGGKSANIKLSEFISSAKSGQIEKVNVLNETAIGYMKDGTRFRTIFPESYVGRVIDTLSANNVEYDFMAIDGQKTLFDRLLGLFLVILSWLPMIIISFFLLWPMIQQYRNKNKSGSGDGVSGGFFGGGNIFSFGKSKARAMMPNEINIHFDDVAGIDEAKDDIVEIVDFLRDPQKYFDIGGKIPRGCLLVGQPGTGKTLLAKAIACEARVPFFFISGSDFVEMFVGVGASRVRDMFEQAKKRAPCIVFIDEIDAVGRNRGNGYGGGNDEREQTLNQLLVEMDGFQENSGIVVIAASNRPDVLDPALLRPGRFDRQIVVNLPDINGREAILKVHAKKVKLAPDVDLKTIARGTPGFSGADLANIINESALRAARKNHKVITMSDMENAKDKVMMGSERKSMVMKLEERKLTAYHEGGHAIVSLNQPASDPIHKATIIPRGRALGMVMRLPEEDKFSETRESMLANMAIAMGGRCAEEMIFGYDKVTSGASSDIQQCTKIARNMVIKWGLSDKVGAINYATENEGYLGNEEKIHQCSDKTAEIIDEEIKKLVDDAYKTAKKILTEKRDDLEKLAQALLEYETLTGDEIKRVLAGEKLNKDAESSQRVIATRKNKSGFAGAIKKMDEIKKDKKDNEEDNNK